MNAHSFNLAYGNCRAVLTLIPDSVAAGVLTQAQADTLTKLLTLLIQGLMSQSLKEP